MQHSLEAEGALFETEGFSRHGFRRRGRRGSRENFATEKVLVKCLNGVLSRAG